MSKSSNNIIRFIVLYIFLPIALVKLLWSVSLFFLEKGSIDEQKKVDYIYHYNVNFAKQMLPSSEVKPKPKPVKVEEPAAKLNSIKLKATYVNGAASFMVVLNGKEIEFVYLGEKHKGYEVKKVEHNRVVLEKKGEIFYILIDDEEDKKKSSTRKKPSHKRVAGLVDAKSPASHTKSSDASTVPDEPTSITRKEIGGYLKNPNKIWRSIRIQEIRKSGQIDGFRINYVKKGSFFAKGGLRAGDVIKSIDGKEIKSLSDVMKYYSNIDTLEGLSLGVKRGQDEIDLEFSISE